MAACPQVPGFYEEVEPDLIELAWTSLEHSEEFSLEGYKVGRRGGGAGPREAFK
mgnify:CR=1 FL=1